MRRRSESRTTVLIPEENTKDLAEIPDNIKNKLDIHPVKWIDQVLEMALERKPEPLAEASEKVDVVALAGDAGRPDSSVVTKH